MVEIYGNFIEETSNAEYLAIGFSPSSIPLKQRWRNNGLSADFIADYLQTFFVGQSKSGEEINIQIRIKDAVRYIANELLENAMKFNDETSRYITRITFHLFSDKLIFHVTNSIAQKELDELRRNIRELLNNDPNELYFRHMESNASHNSNHSGLGFLSMICDFSAQLGWKLEELPMEPLVTTVTTVVCINLANY